MIRGPGQRLTGKTFYLRGGYLDNSLHFNEDGQRTSNAPQASYTLGEHKLELEGVRCGLHFFGGLRSIDPAPAADMVRLTPIRNRPEGDQQTRHRYPARTA